MPNHKAAPLSVRLADATARHDATIARRTEALAQARKDASAARVAAATAEAVAQGAYDASGSDEDRTALDQAQRLGALATDRADRLVKTATKSLDDARKAKRAELDGLRAGHVQHALDDDDLRALAALRVKVLNADVEAIEAGCKARPSATIEPRIDVFMRAELAPVYAWISYENECHKRIGRDVARLDEARKEKLHKLVRERTNRAMRNTHDACFGAGDGVDAATTRRLIGADQGALLSKFQTTVSNADEWFSAEVRKLDLQFETDRLRLAAACGVKPPSSEMPPRLSAWRTALGIRLPAFDVPDEGEPIDLAPVQNDAERAADHTVACDLTPAGAGVWPVGA